MRCELSLSGTVSTNDTEGHPRSQSPPELFQQPATPQCSDSPLLSSPRLTRPKLHWHIAVSQMQSSHTWSSHRALYILRISTEYHQSMPWLPHQLRIISVAENVTRSCLGYSKSGKTIKITAFPEHLMSNCLLLACGSFC